MKTYFFIFFNYFSKYYSFDHNYVISYVQRLQYQNKTMHSKESGRRIFTTVGHLKPYKKINLSIGFSLPPYSSNLSMTY